MTRHVRATLMVALFGFAGFAFADAGPIKNMHKTAKPVVVSDDDPSGNPAPGGDCGNFRVCDGNGACVCDDGNPCTDDYLDGCTCVYVPSFSGTPCDDGNACTGSAGSPDACDGAGECVGGAPPYIDDGNACTMDSCDPLTGGVHIPINCDDFNVCDGPESCNPVTGCVSGPPLVCDDGNPCNGIEECDPALGGCIPGTPMHCNDGNACNGVETCNPASGCVSGTPVVCGPPDQCHSAGVCQPSSGLCSYGNLPNGTTCDDGNAGTAGDSCQNGVCTGSACTSTNDPKTKGWYKSLCHNSHSGDSLTDADAACVGANSTTFAGITTVAQICAVYDSSHQTNCDRAAEELMTLELNICKQRVCPSQGIDSDCGNNSTVGQSESEADALLSNPSRTNAQCDHAECLSKEISNGHALELNTLTAIRQGGTFRLNWNAPTLDDGTGTPSSYRIWRRALGSTAPFVSIGTTIETTYVDSTAGAGSWQYDVTPEF